MPRYSQSLLFFLQQIQHVRQVQLKKPGRLDLKTAEDEEFAPDKLRAQIERFYLTVVRSATHLATRLSFLRVNLPP